MKPTDKNFSEICLMMGKNEQDYSIIPDATPDVNFRICTNRLWLLSKAFNGDREVVFKDTKQRKYTPWHRIVPDVDRPFGFRFSFYGYVFDDDDSDLGARPPFLDSSDAVYVGENFVEEFEQWHYYMDLAYRQL